MSENADARRMQLMELLAENAEPKCLEDLAHLAGCDTRTIRRDLDYLQKLLQQVNGIEVRRGRVLVARAGYSSGYFTDQLDVNQAAKQAIARTVVKNLPDNTAVALTAGSTTYAVACAIRRSVVEENSPSNLMVFTNSVPALLELMASGIATGVLGEIYNYDDCAFHTPEPCNAFQPEVAVVGASGVMLGSEAFGIGIDLFSHRAEEAAFLKQILQGVPEIILAVDRMKLGKRHPWSFGGNVLHGKGVHLITDKLTPEQTEELDNLTVRLAGSGIRFRYTAAPDAEG